MGLEFTLNSLVVQAAPLDKVVATIKEGLAKLAAKDDSIGPPYHYDRHRPGRAKGRLTGASREKGRKISMRLFLDQSALKEVEEVLVAEGVTYQKRAGSQQEPVTGNWLMFQVEANLPEVQVPKEYVQSEGDVRAFRLPSGKLIITDLEGNLEEITTPVPKA